MNNMQIIIAENDFCFYEIGKKFKKNNLSRKVKRANGGNLSEILKSADRDVLLLYALEVDGEIAKEVIKRLEELMLSAKEANKLLFSKSSLIVEYALKYADKKGIIELFKTSEKFIDNAYLHLRKFEINLIDADRLLKTNHSKLWKLAIDFAGKSSLIEFVQKDRDPFILVRALRKLEELEDYSLIETDVKRLFASKSPQVRIFATKYASREIALEQIMIERNTSVYRELREKINYIKPLSKKEEVKIFIKNF